MHNIPGGKTTLATLSPAAVPEPTATFLALLAALGLTGLLASRKKPAGNLRLQHSRVIVPIPILSRRVHYQAP
jgi:hypothetical protein